ncbi:MAG: hypothetical protein QHH06_14915 [Clostridiales bacterium]|jgi:hypothetical protein|nr:hypothetical protein [Eubacteriales bacterium]MDH7567729.1 hypothetical protein [Clostridiales bacterium]
MRTALKKYRVWYKAVGSYTRQCAYIEASTAADAKKIVEERIPGSKVVKAWRVEQ